jgi:hypothetical protein
MDEAPFGPLALPGPARDIADAIEVHNLSIAISWHRVVKRYSAGQRTAASVAGVARKGCDALVKDALHLATAGHDSYPVQSAPSLVRVSSAETAGI